MSKKTAPKRGNVTMKMRNDPFLIGSLSHLRKKKEQNTGNTVFRHIKKRTIEVNEKQWEQIKNTANRLKKVYQEKKLEVKRRKQWILNTSKYSQKSMDKSSCSSFSYKTNQFIQKSLEMPKSSFLMAITIKHLSKWP